MWGLVGSEEPLWESKEYEMGFKILSVKSQFRFHFAKMV